MTERMLMDNYLMLLKSCVEVYVHGTLESSNNDVRKCLKSSLDEIMDSQYNTYLQMTEYGWYTIDNIETNKIKKVLSKVKE